MIRSPGTVAGQAAFTLLSRWRDGRLGGSVRPPTEEATMATQTIDEARLEEFVGQLVTELGASLNAALVMIGDRLGLYRAMDGAGALTPGELAARTDTARALRARVAERPGGGRLRRATTRTPSATRCRPSRPSCSRSEDSPAAFAGAFQLVSATVHDADRIAEDFQTRRRRRLARASPRPLRGHRALLPAGLQREPGQLVDPGARRRRGEAAGRRARGRHRLRARRLDDPHGAGLPELDVRRLRLPRRLDRGAPAARAGGGRGRPGALRGRRGGRLPGHRARPGRVLRLPARHGRSRRRRGGTCSRRSRPTARG